MGTRGLQNSSASTLIFGHPPAVMQQNRAKYTTLIMYVTCVTIYNTCRFIYIGALASNVFTIHIGMQAQYIWSYCIELVGQHLRGISVIDLFITTCTQHLHSSALLHMSAYNVCIHLHTLAHVYIQRLHSSAHSCTRLHTTSAFICTLLHVCMLCTSTACLHHTIST